MVDETTGSLFPADLFAHPGDQPAVVLENLSKQMCQWYRDIGIFATAQPALLVVERLEKLNPTGIHLMHGESLPQGVWPVYARILQSEPLKERCWDECCQPGSIDLIFSVRLSQ